MGAVLRFRGREPSTEGIPKRFSAGGENDSEEMRVGHGREPGGKKAGDEAGTEGGPEVMGQGWI